MNDDTGAVLSVHERLLGPGAVVDNPLALLGLAAMPGSDAEVIAALQQRLAQLAGQAEGQGPEANQVRFALHAAAAKLLNPTLRPALPQAGVPGGAAGSGGAAGVGLQAMLLREIAMSGGWNRRAMHRALVIARSQGLEPAQLIAALQAARGGTAATNGGAVAPARAVARRRDVIGGDAGVAPSARAVQSLMEPPATNPEDALDPARRLLTIGAWVVGGIIAVLLAIVAIVVVVSKAPPRVKPGPAAGPAAGVVANAKPPDSKPAQAPANATGDGPDSVKPEVTKTPDRVTKSRSHVEEWGDLMRSLEETTAKLRANNEAALQELSTVVEKIGQRWTGAGQDERRAAVNALVETVYASAGVSADLGQRVVRVLAPVRVETQLLASEDVLPRVWSAGMMSRLGGERDMPRAVVKEVDGAAERIFGGVGAQPTESSFDAGAAAYLSLAESRLVPATAPSNEKDAAALEEGWKRWVAACAAVRGDTSPLYQKLLLQALDRLLTAMPEPTVNQAVFDAVTLLVAKLPWREEDESRRWLLRAFDNPAVSIADLYTVTTALVTRSGASGVDQTMVLGMGAGDSGRGALRDQYASVWGLASAETRDALVSKWEEAAKNELTAAPGGTPLGALARAVTMAKLNAAAAAIWSGRPDDAASLLGSFDSGLAKQLTAGSTVLKPALERGLSTWAIRYLTESQGSNFPKRRQLIAEYQGVPSVAEAEIIVEEAMFCANDGVRNDAKALIRKHAGEAAVVAAMLSKAPVLPQSPAVSDLVKSVSMASLPAWRDPAWRVAVRRALVERLLELLAADSEEGLADRASAALAEAYDTWSTRPAGEADAGKAIRAAPAPEIAAQAVTTMWLREAEGAVPTGKEPVGLAKLAAARSARMKLAQGRVQMFACEQVSACELMAYVVTAERSSRAGAVAEILAKLTEARRSAPHVFMQISHVEQAMLELWTIRLAAGPAKTGGGP